MEFSSHLLDAPLPLSSILLSIVCDEVLEVVSINFGTTVRCDHRPIRMHGGRAEKLNQKCKMVGPKNVRWPTRN
jgi:hypothetical protein